MNIKTMSIRLPADQAEELEAVARVEGIAVSEAIRQAVGKLIEERRNDTAFRDRLRETVERDRRLLERLGDA